LFGKRGGNGGNSGNDHGSGCVGGKMVQAHTSAMVMGERDKTGRRCAVAFVARGTRGVVVATSSSGGSAGVCCPLIDRQRW
jgi:hypothetical protein